MTEPRADCPELAALNISSLSFGNDHQDADRQAHDAAQACLARLQREGHDAAAYTTTASAEDLHDIFTALGLRRWNIYGLSYGTRLALTYMRLHPADIRSAILDSVYPPQVRFLEDDAARTERAFNLLFAACQADADCRGWYPGLPGRLQALVERSGILVFASHSNEFLARLCRTAMWIDHGTVRLEGSIEEVVRAYEGEDAARHVRDVLAEHAGDWSNP